MGRVGELLIILAIVFLLFGTRRLKDFGSDLGAAIKGFKTQVGVNPVGDSKNLQHQSAETASEALQPEKQHV